MTDSRKRYQVITPEGRKWSRKLTVAEAEQFKQAGFKVQEVEEWHAQPNRRDHRQQGVVMGSRRMPKRLASRKLKRESAEEEKKDES